MVSAWIEGSSRLLSTSANSRGSTLRPAIEVANRRLSTGMTDETLPGITRMSVSSPSVLRTLSLCSSCTTGNPNHSHTHQTCKSTVGTRNADVRVDLDQHVLRRMHVYLGFMERSKHTCRWPALFRGLSSRASKLFGESENIERT